jgi:acetyl-CoA carboxylase carboxyltransferase component
MDNIEKAVEQYRQKRDRLMAMGGPDAVERQRKQGKLTARERIEYFFDPGSFTEIGLYIRHRQSAFGMDKREIPAEGVVTGFGKVDGRYVTVAAEDYTCMAGTFGEYHGNKFTHAMNFAKDNRLPFVGMNDSGGARLHEGFDTLETYFRLFRAQDLASGVIPQIALLMGPCLGGQAYHPVMQDFLIQTRNTGFMGIAGPAFVKTQLGEEITLEELCGWKAHAVKSGCTHVVAEDDRDALDKAKELLAFFPSNNREKPPRIETNDDPERTIPDLNTILPKKASEPFDMREVIDRIADKGYFFEIMKYYARNIIVGFARFNGRPVGLVANQSKWMAGVIDCDAADKGARFIRFCDLFDIPLISLHDCPGYMIGSDQDWKGILRHGAKMLYAWACASVPLIAVIVRKSYAGSHGGMLDKAMGADFVFAWPEAQVSIVGAATAASVIFAREIREAPNPEEVSAKRIKEFSELYENPYPAAERGCVDDIIMPSDTRKMINMALDILPNKTVSRPWRKYPNINL